jgi:transposase
MGRSWLISEHDANRVIRLASVSNWTIPQIMVDRPMVSRAQIKRLIKHYDRVGTIPFTGCPNPRLKLRENERRILRDFIDLDPTLYLDELSTELYKLTGVHRDESQICRSLQEMGLTRKVVSLQPAASLVIP